LGRTPDFWHRPGTAKFRPLRTFVACEPGRSVSRPDVVLARAAGRLLEREDALPVVLHPNDEPAVLLRFVVQRAESSRPWCLAGLRGTIGVFTACVVVQHDHRRAYAVDRLGVLQHLPVTGRVAEGGAGASADLEMDAFGLAGVVVVKQELRLFCEERPTDLIVAVLWSPARTRPPCPAGCGTRIRNRRAHNLGRPTLLRPARPTWNVATARFAYG
jgi:hypothetical protein